MLLPNCVKVCGQGTEIFDAKHSMLNCSNAVGAVTASHTASSAPERLLAVFRGETPTANTQSVVNSKNATMVTIDLVWSFKQWSVKNPV